MLSVNSILQHSAPSLLDGVSYSADGRSLVEYGHNPVNREELRQHQSQLEFWISLFLAGAIHHTLFSEIRQLGSAFPEPSPTEGPLKKAVSFASVVWEISAHPVGRNFLHHFFNQVDGIDSLTLAHASLSPYPSSEGLYPLNGPSQFTRSALSAAISKMVPDVVLRLCNFIVSELKSTGDSKRWPSIRSLNVLPVHTFLTLNIWGVPGLTTSAASRFATLKSLLIQRPRSVVALQEMWDTRSSVLIDPQIAPYIVTSPGYPGLKGRAGLAIFSQYQILDSYSLAFENYAGIECAVRKGALAARIRLPCGREVLTVTFHLISPPEWGSHLLCASRTITNLRLKQIKELVSWVDSIRKARDDVILMGDCNFTEGGSEHQAMTSAMGNDLRRTRLPLLDELSFSERVLREGRSFDLIRNRWARAYNDRFDYIFGRFNNPTSVDLDTRLVFTRPSDQVSDHFGEELRIRWSDK